MGHPVAGVYHQTALLPQDLALHTPYTTSRLRSNLSQMTAGEVRFHSEDLHEQTLGNARIRLQSPIVLPKPEDRCHYFG